MVRSRKNGTATPITRGRRDGQHRAAHDDATEPSIVPDEQHDPGDDRGEHQQRDAVLVRDLGRDRIGDGPKGRPLDPRGVSRRRLGAENDAPTRPPRPPARSRPLPPTPRLPIVAHARHGEQPPASRNPETWSKTPISTSAPTAAAATGAVRGARPRRGSQPSHRAAQERVHPRLAAVHDLERAQRHHRDPTTPATRRVRIHHTNSPSDATLKTNDGSRITRSPAPARAAGSRSR